MGYSGYTQFLCKNGHYYAEDAYLISPEVCPDCQEPFVWSNSVNTTNGEFDGGNRRIDGFVTLEIDKYAEFVECDKCHHSKEVKVQTYKIPKETK